MLKYIKSKRFGFWAVCAIAAMVLLSAFALSCSGEKLTFKADYYFVCYRITDNAVSASSLSGTVASYGGAGYILSYKENYYVTVACYYKKTDANSVCESLKRRDLECSVLEVNTENYDIKRSENKNSNLYLGNFNTLNSLSTLAYECANKLDTGEFSQSEAKDVVAAIKSSLKGLLKENTSNSFTNDLTFLIAQCEDKQRGLLLSKDMRYLQIAIIDSIINAQLK